MIFTYPVQRQMLPRQEMSDFGVRRRGVHFKKRGGCENEPRRAEAALDGAVIDEGLLHARQLTRLPDALDRTHAAAVYVDSKQSAAAGREPVDKHRASAANLDIARALHALETQAIAQDIDQQVARLDLHPPRLSIELEGDCDFVAHVAVSCCQAMEMSKQARRIITQTRCRL